ncbi:unnamed protein product [Ixodes pacificus]
MPRDSCSLVFVVSKSWQLLAPPSWCLEPSGFMECDFLSNRYGVWRSVQYQFLEIGAVSTVLASRITESTSCTFRRARRQRPVTTDNGNFTEITVTRSCCQTLGSTESVVNELGHMALPRACDIRRSRDCDVAEF